MGGGLRRLGGLALLVIVILWVVRDPAGAAVAAKAIGHFANQAADAMGTLASNL